MFDLTLTKELTELIARNLTFPDIEAIGSYLFKNYNTHILEGISENITISPLNAAKRLVYECEHNNKLDLLFTFVIELDNTLLNGKVVNINGLENLLYKLANSGIYYDFNNRGLRFENQDIKLLKNWGVLKEGREYSITIASLDVCDSSNLVKKYRPAAIEEVYFNLWEFIRKKIDAYDGRIWSWAGDGGLLAFRNENGIPWGVTCCLEILLSIPIFNLSPHRLINDEISLRIGMDYGMIKYSSETGRIISNVINFASRLEKNATCPNGISISDSLYKKLSSEMRNIFINSTIFEDRIAYTLSFEFSKAIS